MRFVLNEKARKATEQSVGLSCDTIMRKPIDSYTCAPAGKSNKGSRQVKSRGSVYIQQGRLASVDFYKNIIAKF